MKSYEQIVAAYQSRKKETMVDSITAGLTCVDDLAVESGWVESAGMAAEKMEGVCGILPFVVIAATEGAKVASHTKPAKTGLRDGAFRMAKSGIAMGIGAVVATSVNAWAAIPTAMAVRTFCDRYKSKMLTGIRVQERILRLQELNQHIRHKGENVPAHLEEHSVDLKNVVPVD